MAEKPKTAVTLAVLESRLHEVNAIKTGIKLFNSRKVTYFYDDEFGYIADVDDKNNPRRCTFTFTRDGLDVDEFYCTCSSARDGALVF